MKLDTLESAERFDKRLREAVGANVPLHLNLASAWRACRIHPAGDRILPAVLDLQLHVVRLDAELHAVAERVNADLHDTSNVDCLANDAEFAARLKLFGDTTAFVLRYRALWDKLMGILVLLIEPTRYDTFVNSRSRKKTFVTLVESRGGSWRDYAQTVSETIDTFDSRFRTAEAHSSGRARKFVFSRMTADANPLEDLFWAWNSLNDQLIGLQEVFTKTGPNQGLQPTENVTRKRGHIR